MLCLCEILAIYISYSGRQYIQMPFSFGKCTNILFFPPAYFRCKLVQKLILIMDLDLDPGVHMICSELKDTDRSLF